MYDYRARFYDPALGRFISADPLVPEPGNPQGLNRYAYVTNNPLRYTDPSRHWLEVEDEVISPPRCRGRRDYSKITLCSRRLCGESL